jgi:hypothetical protein
MLALMIHAHPRLAMPPESRFLTATWRKRAAFGDLQTPRQRRALARSCVGKGSRIRHLGLDRKQTRRAILAAPPTLGSAFGTVFAEYARQHGKARWGDKRPLYFQEVDVLLRLFPDAQVVHIVRDGRANVASLKRMPWWPYDSVASMATWSQAEYCAQRNLRRLPADTFHLVRYESLVADPRSVLHRLCDFLTEDFDEAMLAPHRVSSVIPDGKTWHANLRAGVTSDHAQAWRDELEPWEVGLMETVLRRKLSRHGYELSGAGTRPSPGQLARYATEAARRQISMHRRWAQERRETAAATYPVAAQLTTRQVEAARARGEMAG